MNKPVIAVKNLIILGLLILGFVSIIATGGGGGGDGSGSDSVVNDPCDSTIVPQLAIEPRFVIKTFYQVVGETTVHPLPNTKLTYRIYRKEYCGGTIIDLAGKENEPLTAYTEEDATFETTQVSGARFNNSKDMIYIYVSAWPSDPFPAGISSMGTLPLFVIDPLSYTEAKNKGVTSFDVPINLIFEAFRASPTDCASTVVSQLTIKPTFKIKTFYQVGNETPQPLPNASFYFWVFKRPCSGTQINFVNKWLNYTGNNATFEYTTLTSQGTYYTNSQDQIGITVETAYIPTGSDLPAGIASIESATAEAVILYNEAKGSSTGKITKEVNLIHKAYRKVQ